MSVDFAPAIELRVLDPRLEDWGLPRYRTDMAAAVDLHACVEAPLSLRPATAPVLIPVGFALSIADPHVAAILLPRSGLGHGRGLVLGNLVGLIDADYQGPVMVSAWNRNPGGTDPIVVAPGDRIAQMAFVPIVRPTFRVVADFTRRTARGAGGFGSTGHGG
jgi:dUTP pyrophosphatase